MKITNIALWTVLLLSAGCRSDEPKPASSDPEDYRLTSVSTYVENAGGFTPSGKTTYTYSAEGRMESSVYAPYNSATQQYASFSRMTYSRDSQGRVVLITATILNTNVEESVLYRYRADGTLASMHYDSNLHADIMVTYLPGDTLQAVYLYSNGNTFTYKAFMKAGNPVYEKTINADNRITDESTNTFDDHVNPYSLLGYTNYLFVNFSKNNPVTAATQYYIGSAEAIPESYEYTYNEAGLPLTQIVTYKSSDPLHKRHMKYVFEYTQ